MAKRRREDGPIDAAAAYEAAIPFARLRDLELHQRLVGKPSEHQDLRWYFDRLADGRMRIIGYQAPRRRDEAPILLLVEMVARAVAPELHKIDGPSLLALLTPRPSLGRLPDWYVESPTRAAEREARWRERVERVIPPKAIDWRGGQVAIDGMVFTECRVILAEDLAEFARNKIPHGHQGRIVSEACEQLWADDAGDWLDNDVSLPMIADELLERTGSSSPLQSIRRASLEKVIGKSRLEARAKVRRKP